VFEQVALCQAFKLVAQRWDIGADWSKDGFCDTIKENFVKRIPKSLKPRDLRGRWSERTAGSMQTQFDRKIAPDMQRFAHFFKVVSAKKQLTSRRTEEDLLRAAADLFSGVSAYQFVRQDACSDDERERQRKAWAERTGHVMTYACILMWRVLREMYKFSGTVGGSAIALLWILSSDLRATQCGAPSKPQPTTWNGRSGIWRHNYSVRMACPTAKTTRIKLTRPSPRLVYH